MRYLLVLLALSSVTTRAALPGISFEKFSYRQESCLQVTAASGSQIFIPDHAFTAAPGCDSKITILYREFRSQTDMLIVNLPMDYMQDKTKHHLESAGMFEVYAECGGERLELADGKTIQVRFAAAKMLDSLNAFYLDGNNTWKLLDEPVVNMTFDPADKENAALWGSLPPYTGENGGYPNDGDITFVNPAPTKPVFFMGMNISAMGLFNYDRVLCEEGSIHFAVEFRMKDSHIRVTGKVYVAYKGINTLVYYTPDDWVSQFALLPRNDIRIFTVLDDGVIAVVTARDWSGVNLQKLRDKSYTFELTPVGVAPGSKDELASLTGLQP